LALKGLNRRTIGKKYRLLSSKKPFRKYWVICHRSRSLWEPSRPSTPKTDVGLSHRRRCRRRHRSRRRRIGDVTFLLLRDWLTLQCDLDPDLRKLPHTYYSRLPVTSHREVQCNDY